MAVKRTKQIGLLHMEGDKLIPTEIVRGKGFSLPTRGESPDIDKSRKWYRRFEAGSKSRSKFIGKVNRRVYRGFKDDLRRAKTALTADPSGEEWTMSRRYGKKGVEKKKLTHGERVRQDRSGGEGLFFNPRDAAEVFLARVLKQAVERCKDLFGEVATIQAHFLVPPYSSESDRQNYVKNLSHAVSRLQERGTVPDVEFRLDGLNDTLYEPYGAYYYYAAVEGRVDVHSAQTTYLIVDVGGSTTDLSLVQMTRDGNRSNKIPHTTTVRFGGADVDRILLERLVPGELYESLDDVSYDKALRAFEEAKITVSSNDDPDLAQFQVLDETYELTREVVETYIEEEWESQVSDSLQSFIKGAREKASTRDFEQFDAVFLSGGAANLPSVEKKLRDSLEGLMPKSGEFLRPNRIDSPMSALPALGLAYEVAARTDESQNNRRTPDGTLARAKKIMGRVVTPEEDTLPVQDEEDFEMYKRNHITKIAMRQDKSRREEFPSDSRCVLGGQVDASDLPDLAVMQYRNSLENWKSEGVVEKSLPLKNFEDDSELRLGFSHEARVSRPEEDGTQSFLSVPRLWASQRTSVHPRDTDWRRLDDKQVRKASDEPNVPLSFKPPQIKASTVHLCVDFGMSTTAIAVVTPGAPMPSTKKDLTVFRIATGEDSKSDRNDNDEKNGSETELDWSKVIDQFPIGEEVTVEITSISENLVMAQTAVGAGEVKSEMLPSELSWEESEPDLPEVGDKMKVLVDGHDPEAKTLSLSHRQLPVVRWSAFERTVQTAEPIMVSITKKEGEMAYVNLHPLERSFEVDVSDATESVGEGDEIEVQVTHLDTQEQNLQLKLAEKHSNFGEGGKPPEPPLEEAVRQLRQDVNALQNRLEGTETRQQPTGEPQENASATPEESFDEVKPTKRTAKDLPDLTDELPDRYGYIGDPALRELQEHIERRSSRLILLTGPPGTGKSSFACEVAELLNSHPKGFELISVSPTWFDHTSLLGGASGLGDFRKTRFAKLLVRAWRDHRTRGDDAARYVACLDEINLAHPEQYLAPILVAMEVNDPERRKIEIRGFRPKSEKAPPLYLPPNLVLFGTLNLDATTKMLTPKLLDRSLLIRMSPGKAVLREKFDEASEKKQHDPHEKLKSLLFDEDRTGPSFFEVANSARSPFGFRAVDRAADLLRAPEAGDRAIEHALCSIFLSKLPGTSSLPAFAQSLEQFRNRLNNREFAKAIAIIEHIQKGLPGQFA